MLTYKVYVTVSENSEWNATDAGTFRGCGYHSFAGQEYDGEGNTTAEYDIEVYGEEDVSVIESRLNNDQEVISFEIE